MTMSSNKIIVQNMVCPRCSESVEGILNKLKINFDSVSIGEIKLLKKINPNLLIELEQNLNEKGFTILKDEKLIIVEKVKNLIHVKVANMTFSSEKFSVEISKNLSYNYSYISRVFSANTGLTIEKYLLKCKIDKVKEFGGEFVEIILTGKDFYEAYDKSVIFCSQKKLNFIHPFNDYKIIEGQATLFLEIFNQTDEKIDTLIIPIGGGGLISGAINVFKQLSKKTKIIGVQPAGAPTMKKSINLNKVITLNEIDNFVDGAAVRKVGDLTFDYCKEYLDDIIIIDEDEICKTILDLEKNHNIIAEPAGAMSITALRQVKEEIIGKNVVLMPSFVNLGAYVDEGTMIDTWASVGSCAQILSIYLGKFPFPGRSFKPQ